MMAGFIMDKRYNRAGQDNWGYLDYLMGVTDRFDKGGAIEEGDKVTITTSSLGKDYVGMSGTITSKKLLNDKYSVRLSNGLEMAFSKDEFKHNSINPRFAKGGSLKSAKELSEQDRFELKVLHGLYGFNNGLNINGLYESIGFSNYRFNEYATESQVKKVKKALASLIEKGFVEESGLGYEITQKGADYLREFNWYTFAKGGFVGNVEFNVGDTVWQKDEKRYATVMNNYGDPINGDYGDIRLDTTGNTSIYTFDPNRKSPATVNTATVSPRARPSPSIEPPTTPFAPKGSTTVLITDHLFAPKA
jgi:hypothetical protein